MTASLIDAAKPPTPLVVDLDGTLIKSDLLFEAFFRCLGKNPGSLLQLIPVLFRGKAQLKEELALRVQFDPALLPYDEAVLRLIHEARAAGRPVYLASASNCRFVSAVADYLGVFAGWFGSDASTNVSGQKKARLLTETFGERGYDYIGNGRADVHVWAAASKGIGVRTPARLNKKLTATGVDVMESPKPPLSAWLKLFRIHQYAKNALVFLPLLTSHRFDPGTVLDSALAAIAFSLCASSVYIFNDLVDLAADRAHPTKRNRPLAAGTIPIPSAIAAIPILFLCAVALAAVVSPRFLAVLLLYFALTNAYTCWLKTKMLIDVVVLAMLYTLRVIGGAEAIDVTVSEWLLAFSMFIFASLALVKRYTELATRIDGDLPDPTNRNYRSGDMQIVAALAGAAGFNAVTVFALYISSDSVRALYRHPQYLWLICPILMYWVSRVLMMAHRRAVHDDPIIFALHDRVSIIAGICIAIVLLWAI
ncbi:MAG: UbiA family prenyltransferase [Beijerinckiaceae bacterium]|nr:UbiA family prenyltransferase [Beijerinckiaceae bacterium]MCI0597939.1 UbiA family prenyltransferase [Beijerinckiaceae bacterium]MCI0736545.1 UbiA family prenyltransferase [Beijerinckiaceae bacterium]